jgi:hypothetical protein
MSALEYLQLAGIAAVVLAVSCGAWRWLRHQDAIFPETAKKFGMVFTQEGSGGMFSNTRQSWLLQGMVRGTPLRVESRYETRGRLRMRGTWISTPAPEGMAECRINVCSEPPAANVHLVRSGESQFDARRWITTDAPDMARSLILPEARAELLKCPQPELLLAIEAGKLVLSFPATPFNQAELHAPMEAVLALARSQAR